MSCPDTDRVLELTLHDAADLEAAAHVQECAECRALVRIVLEARASYEPDLVVPEALRARAVDWIVAEAGAAPATSTGAHALDLAASFLLGAATITIAAFGTGSVGSGSFVPLVVTAGLAGTAAAAWERGQVGQELSASG